MRRAVPEDADAVADLVAGAYGHYVERIGALPGPMRADYRRHIAEGQVLVAEDTDSGEIAGLLVLRVTGEGFLLDNVAVAVSHQGRKLGRLLLDRAEEEAARAGFDSIHLYTHEAMTENQAIYAARGYVEYDRRTEDGLCRVFMRKRLGAS